MGSNIYIFKSSTGLAAIVGLVGKRLRATGPEKQTRAGHRGALEGRAEHLTGQSGLTAGLGGTKHHNNFRSIGTRSARPGPGKDQPKTGFSGKQHQHFLIAEMFP